MTRPEVMSPHMKAKPDRFKGDAEFYQDDWEFKLDTMHNPDHGMLAEHLRRAPAVSNATVEFLRGYIIDIRTTEI